MRLTLFSFIVTLACLLSAASYASKSAEIEDLKNCISNWGKTPFNVNKLKYRKISAKVKVFGIGGDVEDDGKTDKPELVLVKPNVSVLSKSTIKLLNPKGWYCLKGDVAVLGSSIVKLACDANLASSKDGGVVMGSATTRNGTAVLGSANIKRVGKCVAKNDSDDAGDDSDAKTTKKTKVDKANKDGDTAED